MMLVFLVSECLRESVTAVFAWGSELQLLDRSMAWAAAFDARLHASGWNDGILGFGMVVAGMAIIAYAAMQTARFLHLRVWGWRAMGIVVDAEQRGSFSSYDATIRFADHFGEMHMLKTDFDAFSDPLGREVAVLYSPRNPSRRAWAANGAPVMAELCLAMLVGATFIGFGIEGTDALAGILTAAVFAA